MFRLIVAKIGRDQID